MPKTIGFYWAKPASEGDFGPSNLTTNTWRTGIEPLPMCTPERNQWDLRFIKNS
jgi:hypothetical protein